MGTVRTAAVLIGSLAAAVPAATVWATPQPINTYGQWTAFVDKSSGKKVCYIGSKPTKSEGKYTSRGEIYLLVTHRPAERVVGEVSFETGYTYRSGNEPVVSIGSRTFTLFTKGSNAWARDAAMDRSLVAAMKAGATLVVKGVSSRGTVTTDTFSLSGFTAAYNAITEACAKP
jgi:invasion protein IalB